MNFDFNFSVFRLSPLKLGQCLLHSSYKYLWELMFVEQTLFKVHNRNVHKDPARRCGTVCCKWDLALWREWEQENLRVLCNSFPWALSYPDALQHLPVHPRPSDVLMATGRCSCLPSHHCAISSLRPQGNTRRGDCKVCQYSQIPYRVMSHNWSGYWRTPCLNEGFFLWWLTGIFLCEKRFTVEIMYQCMWTKYVIQSTVQDKYMQFSLLSQRQEYLTTLWSQQTWESWSSILPQNKK